MVNNCCCGAFSLKFGITLITTAMLMQSLIWLYYSVKSTGRRETVSFVNWGIFIADIFYSKMAV